MSATQCREGSLDTLTAMVNQTLIETGRFFRAPGSMRSRTQLKRNIPLAHEQFQRALDNLSEQIYIAKALLEKDYDAVLEKKSALRPKLAVQEDAHVKEEPVTNNNSKPQPADTTNPSQPAAQPNIKQEPDQPPSAKQSLEMKKQPSNEQNPANNTMPQQHPPSPDIAEVLDFDSLFPDSNNNNNNNDNDPNNDKDGSAEQAFLGGNGFLDMTSNNNTTGANNKDINPFGALLPGLERYASAAGDEFNYDLQPGNNGNQKEGDNNNIANSNGNNNNNNNNTQNNDNQQNPAGGDVNMDDLPPAASSFDELFVGVGNFGGDDENLLDNVDISELDESWFK
ncbi:hypothetical protein AJ79_01010 [Helicocarpus griseus UAMH5409]|uniref:Uncharacterized protein n=1 Tax=Helicocarpus griseus UAMH5409 TaxID=1447875 RepID=A0A2B7Y9Q2_9EURO|nr:hypothetical protein AJ79_01010 [Helicocarpus griseus UAMH5409]